MKKLRLILVTMILTAVATGDYYQIAETQTEGYIGANLMASVTEHSRTIQPMAAATTTNQTKPEEVSSTLTDGTTMKNGTSMTKTIKQNKHTKFIRTKYLFFS